VIPWSLVMLFSVGYNVDQSEVEFLPLLIPHRSHLIDPLIPSGYVAPVLLNKIIIIIMEVKWRDLLSSESLPTTVPTVSRAGSLHFARPTSVNLLRFRCHNRICI
jgi:hypothetical protein